VNGWVGEWEDGWECGACGFLTRHYWTLSCNKPCPECGERYARQATVRQVCEVTVTPRRFWFARKECDFFLQKLEDVKEAGA
jgi:hypothetical protein